MTYPRPIWPRVTDEDIAAVQAALLMSRSDPRYLTSAAGGGPVAEFEARLAQFFGVRHAMATSSGAAALHIAIMAAGVEAGDEVIVSPYTWGQTVSCILQQNAIPVFADIDPHTYNLNPRAIEERLSPYTKAIVVVHLYGHPADMDPILTIARRHNLFVIEDCAQATGALYKGRPVGTLGHFGCFSIGDGKQIIGGEGGFLLTNDDRLYERAVAFGQHPARQWAEIQDPDLRRDIDALIYTYRIHPLAAVIGHSQLRWLDQWNAERRRNHERLSAGLTGIPGIRPVFVAEGCQHVYHQYSPSFVPEEVPGISRETYVAALAAEGVPISLGYVRTPIHLRPRMRERRYVFGRGYPWRAGFREIVYQPGDCPQAEARCALYELSIGAGPAWLGDQTPLIAQILDAFQKVAENLEALRQYERAQAAG